MILKKWKIYKKANNKGIHKSIRENIYTILCILLSIKICNNTYNPKKHNGFIQKQ